MDRRPSAYGPLTSETESSKRFTLLVYDSAVVIQANLEHYPDTKTIAETIQRSLPDEAHRDLANEKCPQLVLSRTAWFHPPTPIEATSEPTRVPFVKVSQNADFTKKGNWFNPKEAQYTFQLDAILGIVEINWAQFLVICRESIPVAEFPSDYPNCLAPDEYTSQASSRPDHLWEGRRDSVVYNMTKVCLVPYHFEVEHWFGGDADMINHPIMTAQVAKIRRNMEVFLSKHHYFSFDINLTHTLQNQNLNHGYRPPGFPAVSQFVPMFEEWLLGPSPKQDWIDTVKKITHRESLIDQSDERFVWNKCITSAFSEGIDKHWLVPVIQGYVGWTTVTIQKEGFTVIQPDAASHQGQVPTRHTLDIYLIGRREWYRSGTRYHCRGINENGNVSNFVESEMILHLGLSDPMSPSTVCEGIHRLSPRMRARLAYVGGTQYQSDDSAVGYGWASFVQIRGSVPLYWEQVMMSRNPAQPPPFLSTLTPSAASGLTSEQYTQQENLKAYKKHFQELRRRYGDIWCFNLLSESRGNENILTSAWRSYDDKMKYSRASKHPARQESPPVADQFPRIFELDFHRNQKTFGFLESLNYNFLSCGMLDALTAVASFQERPLAFGNSLHQHQTGVPRTNCLDCLDRTNAFQYWFGWMFLRSYLKERGFGRFLCDGVQGLNALLSAAPEHSTFEDYASVYSANRTKSSAFAVAFRMRGRGALDNEEPMERLAQISKHPIRQDVLLNPEAGSTQQSEHVNLFQYITSNMWGEHGDRISQIYTGTGSVITHLMVNGKASLNQKLGHFSRSVNRLYQNYFEDQNRNEVITALTTDWKEHQWIHGESTNAIFQDAETLKRMSDLQGHHEPDPDQERSRGTPGFTLPTANAIAAGINTINSWLPTIPKVDDQLTEVLDSLEFD